MRAIRIQSPHESQEHHQRMYCTCGYQQRCTAATQQIQWIAEQTAGMRPLPTQAPPCYASTAVPWLVLVSEGATPSSMTPGFEPREQGDNTHATTSQTLATPNNADLVLNLTCAAAKSCNTRVYATGHGWH
jgi:hypothetical protein